VTHATSETALALADKIRRREVSSVEATKSALDAITRENPHIHAFVELDEKRALRAAEEMDRRIAKNGAELPLFAGVPTGIKDHEHMRFMGTRAGTKALTWFVSPIDSELARKCRDGGMILLGKLSTSELTILPFVDTEIHPPTRNPVHTDHYSGGSSGGSSAAVASGMVPIAPGSDGAGSIRLPASFCGLVGYKPGRGVLFHEHAAVDPFEISAVGPIAKTVRDAAALADVLRRRTVHSKKPAPGSFLAALERPPARLKIKLGVRSSLTHVEPEIESAVRSAAEKLAELGHHVEEGGPFAGTLEEFLPLMARMVRHVPLPPFTEHLLQPTTRWMREQGKGYSKADVVACGAALERRVHDSFGDADVWIVPTCAVHPPKVGQYQGMTGEEVFRSVVPIGAFTAPFNVSGQPAVSVPMGRAKNGLPMGVQLVGRRWTDRKLLALAAELEAATENGAS